MFSSLWLAFFWKVKLILINVYQYVYYVIKEKRIKLITFVYTQWKQRVCNFKQKYARWNNCILSGQVAVMLMHVCGYFCPSMVWHLNLIVKLRSLRTVWQITAFLYSVEQTYPLKSSPNSKMSSHKQLISFSQLLRFPVFLNVFD